MHHLDEYLIKFLVDIWNFQIITVENNSITLGTLTVGAALLVIGVFISKWLSRKASKRLLAKLNLDLSVQHTLESLTFYALVVFTSLFAMRMANLPITIFTVLGGAVAIGVGFGSQNIVNNFISGLILMVERPIKVGDYVEIDDTFGYVEDIGMRATSIRSYGNCNIIMPNSSFLEKRVLNWTHMSDTTIRLAVQVGVAYGSPTEKVKELLTESLKDFPEIDQKRPPLVLFRDFGDSALVFEVLFWTRIRGLLDREQLCSKVRFKIDQLFRENQITIPFPQRDVHLYPSGSNTGVIPSAEA